MSTKQQGFTLIELVVVIVILGLLAATALPKYIDVTTDARVASVQGVAGGLRAAAALGQAQYVVNGNKSASTISMGGTTVNVLIENTYAGQGGRPDGTATGMQVAMPDPDGFVVTPAGGITGAITYQPVSGGSAGCSVVYTPNGSPDPVVATITSC